ncbi:unnamed protein product [Merluccius merluccius]
MHREVQRVPTMHRELQTAYIERPDFRSSSFCCSRDMVEDVRLFALSQLPGSQCPGQCYSAGRGGPASCDGAAASVLEMAAAGAARGQTHREWPGLTTPAGQA